MKYLILLLLLVSNFSYAEQQAFIPQNQAQLSFAPLVKKTAPAVVNIYTKKKVVVRNMMPFFNDPLFRHFFGDRLNGDRHSERMVNSLGSGVIIKQDGLIVTNNHVIQDSDEIIVILPDRREFNAKIILSDKKYDLAMLKIDPKSEKLPYLELFDSDNLEVGDMVLAIGNPFGVGQTVTHGIISAPARTPGVGMSEKFFIQTDAAINPGNSGGALVNMEGKLVGINTAIFSSSGGSNGVGFATPAKLVENVMGNIDTASGLGKIVRPWFGAAVERVTKDIADSIGVKFPRGVIIKQIFKGSPADNAGLKQGDVIISIGGHLIEDEQSLHFRVATANIGQKLIITIIRKGDEITKEIIMTAPVEIPARDIRKISSGNNPFAGVTIANLSPALCEELGLDLSEQGVIVMAVDEESFASRYGILKNDHILAVNNDKITSTSQLIKNLKASGDEGWEILLKRDGKLIRLLAR
jgi:serine protease Do